MEFILNAFFEPLVLMVAAVITFIVCIITHAIKVHKEEKAKKRFEKEHPVKTAWMKFFKINNK